MSFSHTVGKVGKKAQVVMEIRIMRKKAREAPILSTENFHETRWVSRRRQKLMELGYNNLRTFRFRLTINDKLSSYRSNNDYNHMPQQHAITINLSVCNVDLNAFIFKNLSNT